MRHESRQSPVAGQEELTTTHRGGALCVKQEPGLVVAGGEANRRPLVKAQVQHAGGAD